MKNLTINLLVAAILVLPITSSAYFKYNTDNPRAKQLDLYLNETGTVQSVEGWPKWIGRIDNRNQASSSSSVTFGALLDELLRAQTRYASTDMSAVMNSDWPDWIDPPWWMWFLQ